MKIIKRDYYINKLIEVKGTPDIKVITGMRRTGKSIILDSFMQYVKETDADPNIIFIDMQSIKFESLKDYHKLNDYIEDKYIENKNNYVFIDEVQLCKSFELTINSLHSSHKYDIYITGSNAFLLSSDLATLFTGRVMKVEVFPFSFKEYLEYYNSDNAYESFDKYVKFGGLPGSYLYSTDSSKMSYIKEIYDTVILRDLVDKYNIKDVEVLGNLSSFMMDNISYLTSPNRICNVLVTNEYATTNKTVSNYIDYLCNAFIFYRAKRYDLKGKKYLATSEKYYLSDHSIRYAMLGTKNMDYGRVYENIVYMELLRRGYEVYIGKLYQKEIDFVVRKGSEQVYIQVSDNISSTDTLKREVKPLLEIKDAYPKMIIARTMHEEYQYEGIKIIDISNWLLSENIN